MFELPARNADSCDVKEHRISRAQFNHFKKQKANILGNVAGNSENGLIPLSAAAALLAICRSAC
jgi:hypothetical protein